jgi:hypothetical protein
VQKNRYYAKHSYYKKGVLSKEWDFMEDFIVLNTSINDVALAKMLCRSVKSIQIRRSRLKKGRGKEK